MQGSKLYVGNLKFDVTPEDLEILFAELGTVVSVNIIEGKGFGFVEMSNQADAEGAKKKLDGALLKGRTIKVSAAVTKKAKGGRRGGRY